ncbi:MAG TPA: amidase family protein [Xanthobacteraceae bacterium]|nr:amidase family protein [Xanthobacteraceae bacterium]
MSTPTPPSTPRVPPSVAFVRQQFSLSGRAELILDRTIPALASHGARISLTARVWRERPGITFLRCESGKFPRATRDSRFAAAACGIVAGLENTLVQSHERIECCDIYRAGDGVHAAYLKRRARTLGAARRFFQNISPYHRDVLRLERRMFAGPRLKAVVVNSKMVADEIVSHFGFPREKIHLVPNGIDLGRFSLPSLADLRKEARADLNLKADAKVLLLLGSGYERKGLPQAIAALAKMGTKAELLVVGRERKPSYYRELASRHGVAGRVHIFGEQADPVPYLAAADATIREIWGAVSASVVGAIPAREHAKMDHGFLRIAESGRGYTLTDYLDAYIRRSDLANAMARFHARYDLLLTPQMPVPALPAGKENPEEGDYGDNWVEWSPYPYPFNLTQHPAASVPCGFTASGLPIGLQIVGPARQDALVLRAARAFESARPFATLSAPRGVADA